MIHVESMRMREGSILLGLDTVHNFSACSNSESDEFNPVCSAALWIPVFSSQPRLSKGFHERLHVLEIIKSLLRELSHLQNNAQWAALQDMDQTAVQHFQFSIDQMHPDAMFENTTVLNGSMPSRIASKMGHVRLRYLRNARIAVCVFHFLRRAS